MPGEAAAGQWTFYRRRARTANLSCGRKRWQAERRAGQRAQLSATLIGQELWG